jgi:hypothetical protein
VRHELQNLLLYRSLMDCMDPGFSCDLFILLLSSSCARLNETANFTENELLALATRGKWQLFRTPRDICRLKLCRPHLASSVGISGNFLGHV